MFSFLEKKITEEMEQELDQQECIKVYQMVSQILNFEFINSKLRKTNILSIGQKNTSTNKTFSYLSFEQSKISYLKNIK